MSEYVTKSQFLHNSKVSTQAFKPGTILTSSSKSSSDRVPPDMDDIDKSESIDRSSSIPLHGLLSLAN